MSGLEVLLQLLRIALGAKAEAVGELSTAEWWKVFRMAQRNRVVALAAHAFNWVAKPPREVYVPWMAECQQALMRRKHQQEVLGELQSLYRQAGIEMQVLKGERLADLYPSPLLREYSDLDLFFPSRQREADALIAPRLEALPSDDHNHHTKYRFRGVTVESHYHLLNPYYPRSNRAYEAMLLAQHDAEAFLALHLLRHTATHFAADGLKLRDLVDWHLASRYADTAQVEQAAQTYGMMPLLQAMNTLCARYLSPTPTAAAPLSEECCRIMAMFEASPSFPTSDGLERTLWKVRRWREGGWRRHMTYAESDTRLLLQSMAAHLRSPRSITHKM